MAGGTGTSSPSVGGSMGNSAPKAGGQTSYPPPASSVPSGSYGNTGAAQAFNAFQMQQNLQNGMGALGGSQSADPAAQAAATAAAQAAAHGANYQKLDLSGTPLGAIPPDVMARYNQQAAMTNTSNPVDNQQTQSNAVGNAIASNPGVFGGNAGAAQAASVLGKGGKGTSPTSSSGGKGTNPGSTPVKYKAGGAVTSISKQDLDQIIHALQIARGVVKSRKE